MQTWRAHAQLSYEKPDYYMENEGLVIVNNPLQQMAVPHTMVPKSRRENIVYSTRTVQRKLKKCT
jgi:hypothetical protein